MNKYLQSLIDAAVSSGQKIIGLPSGEHIVDSPLVIPAGYQLDGMGATLVVPPGAGPAVHLNGLGASLRRVTIQTADPTTGRGKFGVVVHGDLASVEDVELNGFDTALLIASGTHPIYPATRTYVGSDNCQINRIRIWNSDVGVRAYGPDTNFLDARSIYGQTVGYLVLDESMSGARWTSCYHENMGVLDDASGKMVGFLLKSGGQPILDRCGSDGPIVKSETSGVLMLGGGLECIGPYLEVKASGLNQLQAGDAQTLQGGVCDPATGMGPWVRSKADAQLAGFIPTDELRKRWPNWPAGWVALGTSDGRVSAAFPGHRGIGEDFWIPNGVLRGFPTQIRETIGGGPNYYDGGARGDFVRNAAPEPYFNSGRLVIDFGWICVGGGMWKKMILEVSDA